MTLFCVKTYRMPKTCKKDYCEKVFVPEREKVEAQVAKEYNKKYVAIAKQTVELAKILKEQYVRACNDIYCSNCGFAKTVDNKRKKKLQSMGATSVCRDLKNEYPKYYGKRNV